MKVPVDAIRFLSSNFYYIVAQSVRLATTNFKKFGKKVD